MVPASALRYGALLGHNLAARLEVAKVPLCCLVGASSLFGSVYASGRLDGDALSTAFFVFLLACGGASLNSFQERHRDSLMARTAGRPLVHGRLAAGAALLQGAGLVSGALAALLLVSGAAAALVGVLAVVLYNLVYTTAKARTLHAILAGGVSGALPPYMGWLAAGGDVFSYRASLPVLLLFFWQMPHFFLVILRHREDYLKDILPNLLRSLSERALQRIFLPWVAALATTMITFSVVPHSGGVVLKIPVVANSLLLLGVFSYQLLLRGKHNYPLLFRYLNGALICHMLFVGMARLAA